MRSYQNCTDGSGIEPRRMTSLGSFKGKKTKSAAVYRAGSEVDGIFNLLHGSDPLRIELARLGNEVREKDRELGQANMEIKALKHSERLKEKAVVELTDKLREVDDKSKATKALLETKNLEIKKINEEKKSALTAQFAAEARLRRVHAVQKDDEMPPIEAIIAPLEAELKLTRLEVAKLQDENRVLDRLAKSKENALMEAEHSVQMALAKASLVDDLQNKNLEQIKQIGMCKEDNRILERMHRQMVAEVEKLTQSVCELEEAVLAGGAAANAVRDYRRNVDEINEEKRVLDRELARAKVSAERVAVVVANGWKDAEDKVMPVKQWLEERKFYQGEIQRLKGKLAISECAAKSEAQLKDKYQLRFKLLEERLKSYSKCAVHASSLRRSMSNSRTRGPSLGGPENLSRSASIGSLSRNDNFCRSSKIGDASSLLKQSNNLSTSSCGDCRLSISGNMHSDFNGTGESQNNEVITSLLEIADVGALMKNPKTKDEDYVSGTLYDMLQKEVITLRKASHEKDQSLKDKNGAIEMLAKKVDTLNKAMEVEAKKMHREVAAMEKEFSAMRNGNDQDRRKSNTLLSKNAVAMVG